MEAAKPTENPVCTTGHDLPTPPWGNEWADPGDPHPDEPGVQGDAQRDEDED
jgi:hypothetical protein